MIYCLFLYDASRADAWEALDDVIYYTRAVVRCLEFLVALFVVCAGFHESLFGQWSWSNSTVLVVHCYFNVWQRLQTGWVSFLRRREAVKHINALTAATEDQLIVHNDVCAICYQAMSTDGNVRITRCRHFFHAACLRKWLYVQEKCPMCSAPITLGAEEEETKSDQPPTSEDPTQLSNKSGGQDRKVHFSLENQGNASHGASTVERSEAASGIALASSREIVAASSALAIPSYPDFDHLLQAAQRDVRLAQQREKQARHSRSKSESLARILE